MLFIFWVALLFLSGRCESGFKVQTMKVQVGQDVVLSCRRNDSRLWPGRFFWIRHTSNFVPEVLAALPLHGSPNTKSPRFTVTRPSSSEVVLHLGGAQLTDTGFYFCCETQYLDLPYYNATFLLVTETPHITAVVQASPPDDSMKLHCSVLSDPKKNSCSEGDRVFWFKSGDDESTPDLLIAHDNRGDECEQASPRTCVYDLPINSSDPGTYYCAVVSCGRVLFGNRTTFEAAHARYSLMTFVLPAASLGLCCFGALLLIIIIINIIKQAPNDPDVSSGNQPIWKGYGESSVYTVVCYTQSTAGGSGPQADERRRRDVT